MSNETRDFCGDNEPKSSTNLIARLDFGGFFVFFCPFSLPNSPTRDGSSRSVWGGRGGARDGKAHLLSGPQCPFLAKARKGHCSRVARSRLRFGASSASVAWRDRASFELDASWCRCDWVCDAPKCGICRQKFHLDRLEGLARQYRCVHWWVPIPPVGVCLV